jgi:hypothetical protein
MFDAAIFAGPKDYKALNANDIGITNEEGQPTSARTGASEHE